MPYEDPRTLKLQFSGEHLVSHNTAMVKKEEESVLGYEQILKTLWLPLTLREKKKYNNVSELVM